MSFSMESSQHRDRNQVSCIAGRFFISWATSKAQNGNKYMPINSHFKCQWTKCFDQKFYFSIGIAKASDKIQQLFMIKIFKNPLTNGSIEGTYLNIAKAIYDKSTANIILSSEKLRAFLLNLAKRQIPTLTTSFWLSIESPSHSRQIRKRNKNYPNQRRKRLKTVPVCR